MFNFYAFQPLLLRDFTPRKSLSVNWYSYEWNLWRFSIIYDCHNKCCTLKVWFFMHFANIFCFVGKNLKNTKVYLCLWNSLKFLVEKILYCYIHVFGVVGQMLSILDRIVADLVPQKIWKLKLFRHSQWKTNLTKTGIYKKFCRN